MYNLASHVAGSHPDNPTTSHHIGPNAWQNLLVSCIPDVGRHTCIRLCFDRKYCASSKEKGQQWRQREVSSTHVGDH